MVHSLTLDGKEILRKPKIYFKNVCYAQRNIAVSENYVLTCIESTCSKYVQG